MKKFREQHGEPDVTIIWDRFDDPDDAYACEEKILKAMDVRNSEFWLNKTDRRGPPPRSGTKQKESSKEKVSNTLKKMYACPITRQRMLRNNMEAGWKHSEDAKKKISDCVRKPLTINGVDYESRDHAAERFGIHSSTISMWIKRGRLAPIGDNRYILMAPGCRVKTCHLDFRRPARN